MACGTDTTILDGHIEAGDELALIDLTSSRPIELSFSWLHTHAASLAASLAPLLEPSAVVGLLSERCAEHIAAVLAIWRAGSVYLPLDPEWPAARLAFVLDDAAPGALVVQSGAARRVRALEAWASVPMVRLEDAAVEPNPKGERSRPHGRTRRLSIAEAAEAAF
eukprot:4078446-Prymnesium_polylepis.1